MKKCYIQELVTQVPGRRTDICIMHPDHYIRGTNLIPYDMAVLDICDYQMVLLGKHPTQRLLYIITGKILMLSIYFTILTWSYIPD